MSFLVRNLERIPSKGSRENRSGQEGGDPTVDCFRWVTMVVAGGVTSSYATSCDAGAGIGEQR